MRAACMAVGLMAALVAVVCLRDVMPEIHGAADAALAYVDAQGDGALAAYLALVAFGVMVLVPTTLMDLVGGFLFASRYGLVTTWALTSLAKLAASAVAVVLARYLLRDWARKTLVERHGLLITVSDAVQGQPFRTCCLVRGSYLPCSVTNYGLGVLDVPLAHIAIAACIFTPLYGYQNLVIGSACQDLGEIFRGKPELKTEGTARVKVLPILCNLVLMAIVMRSLRSRLCQSGTDVARMAKAPEARVPIGTSQELHARPLAPMPSWCAAPHGASRPEFYIPDP